MRKTTNQPDLTLPCLVHDLNNVFQTLMEAADLLSTDPRWVSLSAAILRSVERGRNVTQGLQDADRISAPFKTILNNAISFMEDSLAGGHGPKIRFTCRIDSETGLHRIWAWERVFINLFSNAVRAMPAGGVIHVTAHRSGGRIEIIVRDEGGGLAPEILDDLFKPHVSTRGSRGLGLHIVDTIVKQEEGQVRAANRPNGKGAEFIITIPADPIHVALPAHA
jgi:signal transduction histidine kinase